MSSLGRSTRVDPVCPPETSRAVEVRATPRLTASWRRSQDYGVRVDAVEPHFTGSVNTDSLLYECGTQVLLGLQSALANEPISLMIADRDGLVLARMSNDKAILHSLDKVHLAPGFLFSERTAGTNGLGLSLADRAPALVRADEHYCTALRGYTCAAAPVIDPLDGDLAGTINLTTWSQSSSELLLALAQSAAGNTAAMMQVRGAGGTAPRSAPRGHVFHVRAHRWGDDGGDVCTSRAWRAARTQVERGIRAGQVIAVVGEPGAGKNSLVAHARGSVTQRERIITARVPGPGDVNSWLALWTPEMGSHDTCIIVSGLESLPAWAADDLARSFSQVIRPAGVPQPFVLSAADYDAIPDRIAGLIDTVVELPALRAREADILPLARHFGQEQRHRPVGFTPAATRALTNYDWPGNAKQLKQVIRQAAVRAELIDTTHLDPLIFTTGRHALTRLEIFERDEIIRCLTAPNATVARAAAELGMSRATVYRKIAHHGIKLPRHSGAR